MLSLEGRLFTDYSSSEWEVFEIFSSLDRETKLIFSIVR